MAPGRNLEFVKSGLYVSIIVLFSFPVQNFTEI